MVIIKGRQRKKYGSKLELISVDKSISDRCFGGETSMKTVKERLQKRGLSIPSWIDVRYSYLSTYDPDDYKDYDLGYELKEYKEV